MKLSSKITEQTKSHEIFLKKVDENLEREIEEKLRDRFQNLERKESELKKLKTNCTLLEKKLALLNVKDNKLRNAFIGNGETGKDLESEYKQLNEEYQKKIKSLNFKNNEEKEEWSNSKEANQFILDEIKKIKSTLEQRLDQESQQISSIKSVLESNESSLIKDAFSANKRIDEILVSIDWLSEPKRVDEKIANDQWYKSETPTFEMDDLRKKFKENYDAFIIELKADQQKRDQFISENSITDKNILTNFPDKFLIYDFKETQAGKELTKSLVNQKITDLEQERKRLLERKPQIIQELKQLTPDSYPIVWATPGKRKRYGGDVDDFKYGSKKPKKEVYKPYTEIHKALMDANWAIRDGGNLQQNYITAHILLVVSDRPHKPNGEAEYQGGRTFIDFPINIEWRAELDEEMLNSTTALGRGKIRTAPRGEHSEKALEVFLKDQQNVENIVGILKNKLMEKFGENSGFKVYEINLFINSNKNVCNGCEQILDGLQRSQSDESFLFLLKTELEKQGLKTLTTANDQFPRMVISVSAYDYYTAYCSTRLTSDAQLPLQDHKYEPALSGITIDTKPISGKVIVSSDELTLHPDFEYKKKFGAEEKYVTARKSRAQYITLNQDGVPFHSGFASAGGVEDLLKDEKRTKYQPPKSFDGVANVPKKSPQTKNANQVASESQEQGRL